MSENGVHGSFRTWKVGFYNCALKKYLTTEKFGEINVTGKSLKRLQIFTIEQDTAQDPKKPQCVYIRSHLGRYLKADKQGNATLDTEEGRPDGDGDSSHGFIVEYSADGKWAFKHRRFNNYLGANANNVRCYNQTPGDADWWNIQLYVHPQVNLFNVNRKAYAHLNNTDAGSLECTEKIPWGADALVTLEFTEGKYSFKTCDNRYLSHTGELLDELSDAARFNLEVHSGCLAFKDGEGRYLMGVGKGLLKTKNRATVPSKDELFIISDSNPQVQIVSQNGEGKTVSVRQGLDVSANQSSNISDLEDTEIFQMEHNKDNETWSFVTHKNKYWTLKGDNPPTIQIELEKSKKSEFEIEWQDDGSVAFKGSDGNYIANRQTGVMFSNSKDEVNKFVINIVNRPLLVLKGEHGFVGLINKNTQCVCNTSTYDTFSVHCKGKGVYNLKTSTGQYLSLDDSATLVLDESNSADFQFQFCGRSQLAIKAKDGNFLRGDQNGIIKANATELAPNSKWEF